MNSYLPGYCLESWKKTCLNFFPVLKYMLRYATVWKGGAVTWPWTECALLSLPSRNGDAAESVHHSLCLCCPPSLRASEREWWRKGIQAFSPLKAKGPGLPWWSSGWELACQCRGHRFNPCVREDSTCSRAPKPMSRNYWSPCMWVPGSTAREATAMRRPLTARRK